MKSKLIARRRQSAGWIAALAFLAVGTAAWQWQQGRSNEETGVTPAVAVTTTGRLTADRPIGPDIPPAQTPEEISIDPAPRAGHEGHGDECALCLADRKVAALREEYAELLFQQAIEERDVPEVALSPLRGACRRVARESLLRWSFSDSRPELAPDAVVDASRRRWLEPLLSFHPTRSEAP